MRCGRVDDVPFESIALLERSLSTLTDYEIVSHRLEFIGVCPDCRRETGDIAADGSDKRGGAVEGGDGKKIAFRREQHKGGNRF
jgi:hypothetical protein